MLSLNGGSLVISGFIFGGGKLIIVRQPVIEMNSVVRVEKDEFAWIQIENKHV